MLRRQIIRAALWLNGHLPAPLLRHPFAVAAYGIGVVTGIVGNLPGYDGLANTQLFGLPRHHLWAGMALLGGLLGLGGLWSGWWRLELAGCVLFGTGIAAYGIVLLTFSDMDPAVIGLPPIGVGLGAALRLLGLFVLGTTAEVRLTEARPLGGVRGR